MKLNDFSNGMRVYYSGDMANHPWFGTIIETGSTRWGSFLKIAIDDSDRIETFDPIQFSEKYSGNGSTRFVTEQAYNEWRSAQMEKYV